MLNLTPKGWYLEPAAFAERARVALEKLVTSELLFGFVGLGSTLKSLVIIADKKKSARKV